MITKVVLYIKYSFQPVHDPLASVKFGFVYRAITNVINIFDKDKSSGGVR